MLNIKQLGQVWTPDNIAEKMVGLVKNRGRVLEPSSGSGAIFNHLRKYNTVAIELDGSVAHPEAIVQDFFDYPTTEKFDTIIANPPYVRQKGSCNLYIRFILKSLEHLNPNGEMIFLVPRDWTNCTQGLELRRKMNDLGVVTKLVDLSDRKIFANADPDTCCFRFSLNKSEPAGFKLVGGNFIHHSVTGTRLGDICDVHVGMVCKSKSTSVSGYLLAVGSKTKSENIYAMYDVATTEWIRKPNGIKARLFVNCKTRHEKPFFVKSIPWEFEGSVLGLIPQDGVDIHELCDKLNAVDWSKQGMKHGGRFVFSQRNLKEALV